MSLDGPFSLSGFLRLLSAITLNTTFHTARPPVFFLGDFPGLRRGDKHLEADFRMFQEFKNRFSGVFLLNIHLSWPMDYINLPPHGLFGSIKKKS